MVELKIILTEILSKEKLRCKLSYYSALRRTAKQLQTFMSQMKTSSLTQEVIVKFIQDDHGSITRRDQHRHMCKLIDKHLGTRFRDHVGILLNQPPFPKTKETQTYFLEKHPPYDNSIDLSHLINKANQEMSTLHLSKSTMGQYLHAWKEIREYFNDRGMINFDFYILENYLDENLKRYNTNKILIWKWKINRKAASVLSEVMMTGSFEWKLIKKDILFALPQFEQVYETYKNRLQQKNLSQSTIDLYEYVLRRTLFELDQLKDKNIYDTSPEDIQILLQRFSKIFSQRSLLTILPILRKSLSYIYREKLVPVNYENLIPNGFVKKEHIPPTISLEDEAKILRLLDDEPARIRSMVLLAMSLGLRDSDICHLKLSDIDWRKERIHIVQKKTGVRLSLPLLPALGNALKNYLLYERPNQVDSQSLFLRYQAPHKPLASIYSPISNFLKRYSIESSRGKSFGTHLFRYTLVKRLITQKVPHSVVTKILGHKTKESDKSYLSIDTDRLRECCLSLDLIGINRWEGELDG